MGLNIRREEVNRLADRFASLTRLSKTDAVELALTEAIAAREKKLTLQERLQPLLDKLDSYPNVGPPADKAFYDSLNDEED
jgi:antitoxin VapB